VLTDNEKVRMADPKGHSGAVEGSLMG